LGEVEIVGRVERRRKWSAEEKVALLAEIEAEGGRVTVVARRHGISESLLYNWRSAFKAAVSMRMPEPTEFVPIGMIAGAVDQLASVPSPEPCRDERGGMIEIELPTGARVRVDAQVSEKALARVFRALK
jgi:transposase